MCGIAGFTGCADKSLLEKMCDVMLHRGPDDIGIYCDKHAELSIGMRRLSIIDLDGGHQPISNEDGSLIVICNGEIYNSPELRKELLSRGHTFKTKNSDVEVLVHLYEEYGTDCLSRLNGMFAFIIYDKKKSILFGARDRIGIKPLYYMHVDGIFAFASELKALHVLPWFNKEVDHVSLYHYLSFQFVPPPGTIFKGVSKLEPGSYFIYRLKDRTFDTGRYWSLDVRTTNDLNRVQAVEKLKSVLYGSVKRWTLSDVPLACSLSGGMDSSAITAIVSGMQHEQLHTYTVGFGSREAEYCNELGLAADVAAKWNTKHTEIIIDTDAVLTDLESMVWHLDEPYGGGLPSWYIYKEVAKKHKVCLTGSGGDELFTNYGKYRVYQRSFIYKTLRCMRDALVYGTTKEIVNCMQHPFAFFYHRYFSDAYKDRLLAKEILPLNHEKTDPYIDMLRSPVAGSDVKDQIAYLDFAMQLPEEFLTMTDKFSMAHSVEARVPLLDHELVEFIFSLPSSLRVGAGNKELLHSVVQDLLPNTLLKAPKRGFILPLREWTKGKLRPVIEEMLGPYNLKNQAIFTERCYRDIVVPHMQGKRDNTQQIWTLLMFQLWYKNEFFTRTYNR